MIGYNMSVRKSAFLKIGGFNVALSMGEDVDLSKRLRAVGKIKIIPDLIVFTSGRRFRTGLIFGLLTYAPWWFLNVVLHREKTFDFKPVRSEKLLTSDFTYLPLGLTVGFLILLFYFTNPAFIQKIKLF